MIRMKSGLHEYKNYILLDPADELAKMTTVGNRGLLEEDPSFRWDDKYNLSDVAWVSVLCETQEEAKVVSIERDAKSKESAEMEEELPCLMSFLLRTCKGKL